MTQFVVKIGFWLRAYDGLTVEAASDAEAIDKAKAAGAIAMSSAARPERIELEDRREGVIAHIDRLTSDGSQEVIENVEFDDDRIHPPPATLSPALRLNPRARPSRRAFAFLRRLTCPRSSRPMSIA